MGFRVCDSQIFFTIFINKLRVRIPYRSLTLQENLRPVVAGSQLCVVRLPASYLRYFLAWANEAMICPSVPPALGMHFLSSPNAVSEG